MNKHLWFTVLFLYSELIFAANVDCPLESISNAERTSATINSFSYTQAIADNTRVGRLGPCDNQMIARSNFKVGSSKTNLTTTGSGSFPWGINTNITINNSGSGSAAQNLAKIWLSENLKISFEMSDDVSTSVAKITEVDKDYNIHPNTSQPGRVTVNGEEYLKAGNGLRNAGFSVPNFGFSLINKTAASSSIIDALNGATVRIHLGTLTYKYDSYRFESPTGIPKIDSTEVYLNLKLSFIRPTCTMSNQTVNLAPASTSILNTDQTANQQSFNISFDCSVAMSGNTVLARVTDSYTPNNNNSNGILKNQPSLANKSNVDVQLMDDTNKPLTIGTQSSFYKVPAGSNATTFSKTLKARYYRSEAVAKPGYVQAQATVFFDYQ